MSKKEQPHDLDQFELEIYNLSKERLEVTDHDVMKWLCCVKDCKCFNRVKDYGITPYYRWRGRWINLKKNVYFCGTHWKQQDSGVKFEYKFGSGHLHLTSNKKPST